MFRHFKKLSVHQAVYELWKGAIYNSAIRNKQDCDLIPVTPTSGVRKRVKKKLLIEYSEAYDRLSL
jgi:hypothetical protein